MRAQRIVFLVVACCVVLVPASALAQSSITGTVRDISGGVLPGVTVEATSPALIGGARVVVTDSQGLYRIVDLRPGAYTVTFSLASFKTVKREGLELQAEFTATVNADLAVGALEETITVSGEAPLVDIRSSRAQTQYAQETLQSLPGTGRLSTVSEVLPGAVLRRESDRGVGGLSDRTQTALIRPSLGRNLASCPSQTTPTCNSNVTVDLIPANTLYEPRFQQLDLRFTRTFRLGGDQAAAGQFRRL